MKYPAKVHPAYFEKLMPNYEHADVNIHCTGFILIAFFKGNH